MGALVFSGALGAAIRPLPAGGPPGAPGPRVLRAAARAVRPAVSGEAPARSRGRLRAPPACAPAAAPASSRGGVRSPAPAPGGPGRPPRGGAPARARQARSALPAPPPGRVLR